MPSSNANVVTKRSGSVREVLAFSAPLIVSNMSQSAMWVVDTAIMGHVGTAEQGAVGLGGVLVWALTCFFAGTMSVVNILVAQDFGAGRKDLGRHVRTGLVMIIPMTVAMLALSMLVPQALGWLGCKDAVRPFAVTYIQIRVLSAPFVLAMFAISCYLRGVGDTITPMVMSLVANVVNALLAIVLVFGLLGSPKMGVAGAAWATAVAGTVESLLYASVYLWGKSARTHGAREWKTPSVQDLRRFVQLGTPIGMSWMFEMVSWTAFAAYAGTRAPVELAAHMVLFQVTGFCFMPAVAIGVGASTLVGQYLGARRPDLAWRSAGRSLGLGVAYMSVVGGAMLLLRRPLVTAFNPDPAVVALGCTLALLAGSYQPFDGFGIIAQAVLRGAGKTSTPTIVMLGSGFVLFIPLVWILGEYFGLGVTGAWIAALVHVVVVAGVLGVVVVRGKWRNAVPLSLTETPLPTPH
ncbi:MAG: MATE family efflux transporter [Deltaproteobacteria bacterium]|nr:MATE family efflux transporter [Deltaproteobacteria bacterium]